MDPTRGSPFLGGQYMDLEPAISPDGQRFFFMSTRPVPGGTEPVGNEDIWVMDRVGDGWGEPHNLGSPINTEGGRVLSLDHRGRYSLLHPHRWQRDPNRSTARVWWKASYSEPEMLPEQVNSGQLRFNAFIARDESYIIVCVWGREDSLGGVDYYVVFRSPEDVWSEPINMGETVNAAEGAEWSPYVSPDGEHLFFMSSRGNHQGPVFTGTSDLRLATGSAQAADERQFRYLVDRCPDHRGAPTRRLLTVWSSAVPSPAPPRPRR